MNKLPIVSIVGRPNVGKSTLFNRIVGSKKAITSEVPGTTRDKVVANVSWNDKSFVLVDTAGFLVNYSELESEKNIEKMAQLQIDEALSESDLVLFVIDIKDGITPADLDIANRLNKYSDKVTLVANKADTLEKEKLSYSLNEFGYDKVIPISSISGRRTGLLLDHITKNIEKAEISIDSLPKLAILGRPNVGKSTLFNKLTQEGLSIVSDVPGTTRDTIEAEISIGRRNKKIKIIDTAGVRKRGRVQKGIERFSVIRSLRAATRADLCLIVVDALEGITRQDAHLVQMAIDNNCKVIVVVNKIDLLEEQIASEIPNMYRYLFINKEVVVAVSARDSSNIKLLLREIDKKL